MIWETYVSPKQRPTRKKSGEPGCVAIGTKHRGGSMENEIENIYDEAKQLGVEIANHQSDLYIPVTPGTIALVSQYKFKSIVKTFISRIDKKLWYDIPFAYTPFWDKVQRESDRRKELTCSCH
jgi:hypothetical protein